MQASERLATSSLKGRRKDGAERHHESGSRLEQKGKGQTDRFSRTPLPPTPEGHVTHPNRFWKGISEVKESERGGEVLLVKPFYQLRHG
mmetsp:Transcript_7768/g.15125  ORF Transcript_7768/g.15125 Transcript_7768/m.15125 type:complete len:89 (-) Transcript_7768:1943-2209(-)